MTILYPPYFGGPGYPSPWYSAYFEQRSIRIVTPPSYLEEPITLDQARNHLNLDLDAGTSPPSHPDDTILQQVYIPMARAMCEVISGRAFAPAVFEVGFGQFPCSFVAFSRNGLKLGLSPIRGVTSVVYNDGSGTDVTLDGSAYVVDPYTDGGYVFPAYGTTWPAAIATPNSVRVRFSAGFDPENASPYEFIMPAHYRGAVLMMLEYVYNNRDGYAAISPNNADIPPAIRWALEPSSLVNGFA